MRMCLRSSLFQMILFMIIVQIAALWMTTVVATAPKDTKGKEPELKINQSTSKVSVEFPQQLDLRALKSMPLVILRPKQPINLQLHPTDRIPKNSDLKAILEMIKSASMDPEQLNEIAEKITRQARNRNIQSDSKPPRRPHESSRNFALSSPQMFSHRQGLFTRFSRPFSNILSGMRPMPFSMPTIPRPVYQNPFFGGQANPYLMAGSNPFQSFQQPWQQQFQPSWNQFQPSWNQFQQPSMFSDLMPASSFLDQSRVVMGNQHPVMRPPFMIPVGGDLATSGSRLMQRFFPTRGFLPPRLVANIPRHKPLFNNVDGLQAASMEISNAFADFTDSKEHGPEVSQKFGSVGHTINNFLQMMGFDPASGFTPDDIGAYGGGPGFASMDSTPIARSMDFYPGYGNQANLDHFDDFPMFEEDITEEFHKLHNVLSLNNETDSVESEIVIKMKPEIDPMMFMKPELIHAHLNSNEYAKAQLFSDAEKEEQPDIRLYQDEPKKGRVPQLRNIEKTVKVPQLQQIAPTVKAPQQQQIPPAVNVPQIQQIATTVKEEDQRKSEENIEKPVANYKIPPLHATVAPRHRKLPVAIYQNSDEQQDVETGVKSETYAPAQSLSHNDDQMDSNKLVNEDIIRQWVPVSAGEGYVEKRPVPIINILQASAQPEGLKILRQIISGAARMVRT